MMQYIETNCDSFQNELDVKITKNELLSCIKTLDNNKSTSFDRVSNEMLKSAKLILADPILRLFNSLLEKSIYPKQWSLDILTPLHKKNEKSDPNNFRGVVVSSSLGKLFNKFIQKRLEKHCNLKNIINEIQGSGKANSRTSDHHLIIRFLLDKYVNGQGKKIFVCFVDLQKAYDTVPRIPLFYLFFEISTNLARTQQKQQGFCQTFRGPAGAF